VGAVGESQLKGAGLEGSGSRAMGPDVLQVRSCVEYYYECYYKYYYKSVEGCETVHMREGAQLCLSAGWGLRRCSAAQCGSVVAGQANRPSQEDSRSR
jgi:hypothetical protein